MSKYTVAQKLAYKNATKGAKIGIDAEEVWMVILLIAIIIFGIALNVAAILGVVWGIITVVQHGATFWPIAAIAGGGLLLLSNIFRGRS